MDYHFGTFAWSPKLAKIHTRPYGILLGGLLTAYLGFAVVLDQFSIVNCGLELPVSPITSGEETGPHAKVVASA